MLAQAPLLILLFTVSGMQVPESVCYYKDKLYVSNIVGEPWEHDEKGYISVLTAEGDMIEREWRTGTADAALSAPKGSCVLEQRLYVADINRVHWFSLSDNDSGTIEVQGSKNLNDAATDGKAVFVSDSAQGVFFRVDPKTEKVEKFDAVPRLNGITFYKDHMIGVSWSEHEVYGLDPNGQMPPQALGIAEHLKSADGVEVLSDQWLIVSDFVGNAVYLVATDGDRVVKLLETQTPADIGLDREGKRLFVPSFKGNKVEGYEPRGPNGGG